MFFGIRRFEEPQTIMHGNDIEIALAPRRSPLAVRLYPTVTDVVRSVLFAEHGSTPALIRETLFGDVCSDMPAKRSNAVRIIAIICVARFQNGVVQSPATGQRAAEKRIDLDTGKPLQ